MRSVLSSSASATWLDREAVLGALRDLAGRLVDRCPEVQAVVLFGSMARAQGVPGSDADLLVILQRSPHRRRMDRIPELLAAMAGAPVPLDIHPYTLVEMDAAGRGGNPLLAAALAEGVTLAGAWQDPLARFPP